MLEELLQGFCVAWERDGELKVRTYWWLRDIDQVMQYHEHPSVRVESTGVRAVDFTSLGPRLDKENYGSDTRVS